MKFGGAQISRNFRRNLGVWPDFILGLKISQVSHLEFNSRLRKSPRFHTRRHRAVSRVVRDDCRRARPARPDVPMRGFALLLSHSFVGLLLIIITASHLGRSRRFREIFCFHCERRKSSSSKFLSKISRNLGALAAKLMIEIWGWSGRKSALGQPGGLITCPERSCRAYLFDKCLDF